MNPNNHERMIRPTRLDACCAAGRIERRLLFPCSPVHSKSNYEDCNADDQIAHLKTLKTIDIQRSKYQMESLSEQSL